MRKRLVILSVIVATIVIFCVYIAFKVKPQTTHVSEEKFDIYSYLPIFADKTDKTIQDVTMDEYTFIYLHCDNEQNFAYVQDFKNDEPVSPLYLYEFTESITMSTLLNDMPERSKDFEVDSSIQNQVENFYDKLEQYTDSSWQVYEKENYLFRYANVMKEDHYYNEKRIYKNDHPVCFMSELSDAYKVNENEVSTDAYVWLRKD